MAKSLGVSATKSNHWLLDSENSEVWMVLPQFAHDPYLSVEFWGCGNEWSPVFAAEGRHGGLANKWERR